jgi:hypothetical protein
MLVGVESRADAKFVCRFKLMCERIPFVDDFMRCGRRGSAEALGDPRLGWNHGSSKPLYRKKVAVGSGMPGSGKPFHSDGGDELG